MKKKNVTYFNFDNLFIKCNQIFYKFLRVINDINMQVNQFITIAVTVLIANSNCRRNFFRK